MDKPNILLITTDQQRFDTINALGNKHIYTPHLNWLVDNGIAFTRCYSDCPVCMPARATIMIGKHGYTTGLLGNGDEIKPMKDNPTLPEILTRNGYQTRAQGKMHFSPMRANYGFEHMELLPDYYRYMKKHPQNGLPKQHGLGENEIEPVISTVSEENSLTHWTVERSIDFLETRDESRPFFLWTSFAKPHPPLDPTFNYWSLYRDREVPDPVYGDWSKSLEETPQGYMEFTYFLNNMYRMTKDQCKDVRRAYYACITEIDYSLGLLFGRMREMGLMKNTWIVFTSDHGDMMGDHRMGAKMVFFEGAAHVPLIICPPPESNEYKDITGTKCDTISDLTDILPTILNMVGIDAPDDVEGMDIMSAIGKPIENRVFYGNFRNTRFAVIENEYKYLWTTLGGDELLFDLKNDPYEQENLATRAEHQEKLVKMRNMMIEHIKEHCPDLLKDGELVSEEAPKGPQDVRKWPGFHTIKVEEDILH